MSARDRILAAIRAARPAPLPPAEAIAAEAAALLDAPESVRPRPVEAVLAAEFVRKASALGTSFDHLPDRAAIPLAVKRYLDTHGLPPALALQPAPALAALDWTGIDTHEAVAPDRTAALGLALWGIAETGSLVPPDDLDALSGALRHWLDDAPAREAAMNGWAALSKHIKGLTEAQRKQLDPESYSLKKAAKDADGARTAG